MWFQCIYLLFILLTGVLLFWCAIPCVLELVMVGFRVLDLRRIAVEILKTQDCINASLSCSLECFVTNHLMKFSISFILSLLSSSFYCNYGYC